MAKKQAQFRFEENFYEDINEIAKTEGTTVSEIVRNALKIYKIIYERTKDRKTKMYIEYEDSTNEKCEIILPWFP
jgi:hypothetical protein